MEHAIIQAKLCNNDVPVGCVIKRGGEIIASAHNMREELNDVTAHAEIIAIKEAQKKLNTSRLNDCDMYVTLEPCPMCSWAIIQAGIGNLYFGAYNNQYGGIESVINLPAIANSKMKIYGGIKEEECKLLLDNFFHRIRNDNQNRA